MIKIKYMKGIIIVLCIMFITITVVSAIFTENHLHTDNCKIEGCPICYLIHFSTGVINYIKLADIDAGFITMIAIILQLLNVQIENIRKLTLVNLKIIQNN